ncbi:hypothetical protein MNBD_GAMMA06-771 [hydrothermal vent metagenome]|uniref:RDD domain-containing protein n=1 Tax=hydrothermal vent metagenome TaxID=652676 RepID=A0A3B0X6M0_9ZZZZ
METTKDATLTISSADALHYSLEIAGIGARAYAFVIDWHIRLLFALLWLYASITLIPGIGSIQEFFSEDFDSTTNSTVITTTIIFLPAVIGYFFYHPILEILMHGRTPGKRIADVRLVTTQGHIPDAGSLLIRNVFRIIDSLPGVYTIGIVVCLFTKKHIRIGDIAAGTILVYENKADTTITDVVKQTLNATIPAGDYELLLEIINRWEQLLPEKRLQLGHQLLSKISDDFHTEKDRELKKHLIKLKNKLGHLY